MVVRVFGPRSLFCCLFVLIVQRLTFAALLGALFSSAHHAEAFPGFDILFIFFFYFFFFHSFLLLLSPPFRLLSLARPSSLIPFRSLSPYFTIPLLSLPFVPFPCPLCLTKSTSQILLLLLLPSLSPPLRLLPPSPPPSPPPLSSFPSPPSPPPTNKQSNNYAMPVMIKTHQTVIPV